MDQNQKGQECACACHKMVPVLIVLLGLLFLLQALGILSAAVTGIIWPILLILIGLKKMLKNNCKCCKKSDEAKS
jgi:uncharacterized membrane protein